ncbi:MAG: hypothetical protein LBP21_05145, partial [Synergistaceae bacterium]|nr:hypothetical protein [Synergistaceae bacterium]
MKVSKRFILAVAALAMVLAAGNFAGVSAAADDPLAGNYSVMLKDRVVLTAVGANRTDASFYTATSKDANPVSLIPPQQTGSVTLPGAVAAMTSVGGYVSDTGEVDFYGTTLPGTGRGVVASAYLIETSTAGAYDIYLTLADKDGNLLKDAGANPKAFKLGADERVPATLPGGSYFSLVGNDWNNDGCTDYILSYPTFTGSAGNSGSNGTLEISSVYIDGKTCYSAAKTNPASTPSVGSTRQLVSYTAYGNASFSVSTAVGDLDGDGEKEFIAFYANSGTEGNCLDIYNIAPQTGSDADFKISQQRTVNSSQVGFDDVLTVTAGDFDGDGKDKAALIYSDGGNMYLSMSTPDGSGLLSSVQIYPRQQHSSNDQARFAALATDLDGDGRDELVWDLLEIVGLLDGASARNLHIHTWPNGFASSSATDPGTQVDFRVGYPSSIGDGDTTYPQVNHSMVALPYSNGFSDTHHALAFLTAYTAQSSPTPTPFPPILLGVVKGQATIEEVKMLEILPVSAFQTNGSWRRDGVVGTHPSSGLGTTYANQAAALAAADLYDESMVLGEPVEFTLTGQVKPRAIIQAPPKHWD